MAYFPSSPSDQAFANIGARLRALVEASEPALRAVPDSPASRPRAPGKWSAKQILGHLIDSATNDDHRFVRAQHETPLEVASYAQETLGRVTALRRATLVGARRSVARVEQ